MIIADKNYVGAYFVFPNVPDTPLVIVNTVAACVYIDVVTDIILYLLNAVNAPVAPKFYKKLW